LLGVRAATIKPTHYRHSIAAPQADLGLDHRNYRVDEAIWFDCEAVRKQSGRRLMSQLRTQIGSGRQEGQADCPNFF